MVVIMKGTHMVRPAEAGPKEMMQLSSCDQIKDIMHTPTIYFYQHSPMLESADVVSILKDSLSKALVVFYPLSGRLNWSPEGGSRVELHCNGKGVPIYEAESDDAVEDFGDFTPTKAMQPLFPSVYYTTPIHEIPMVIVQVTKFRCGGLSIGVGISHVMADGPSAVHFINEWTKFARGSGPIIPPFLNRKIMESDQPPNFKFDTTVLRPPPTLLGNENSLDQRKKPIAVAFLALTKLQIEKLRSSANLDGYKRGFSRFEAVAAHIWRCTTKARRHAADQDTSLYFVADFRNKLQPPLPLNYFGNALIRVEAKDKSGNLVTSSIGTACKKIRESVEKVSDDTVRGYLEFVKKLPDVGRFRALDNNGRPKGDFYGNPNLGIISWTGLPMFGADFGWGNEIHLGPGPMGFDGKTLIIPDRQGNGSLNVAIWLQEEHMGDFKECFYNDI